MQGVNTRKKILLARNCFKSSEDMKSRVFLIRVTLCNFFGINCKCESIRLMLKSNNQIRQILNFMQKVRSVA